MRDYEDVTEQAARRDNALMELKCALAQLSTAAKQASRDLRVEPVYGAMSRVSKAEEAYDIAELDLATARGEDA